MADDEALSDDLLTFDLNEWPADMVEALELMLRGRSIAFGWDPPGVLNVSTWHEREVDEFLNYLEAEPAAAPATSGGPIEHGPMSVDDFYSGDERRRESEEVDLGRAWTDTERIRHTLCWVRETGELTLMRVVGRPTIEVLTRSPTLERVEALLGAWAVALEQPNSVGWLRERVAGVRGA